MLGFGTRQKKIECFFCDTQVPETEIWQFNMATADGVINAHICEEHARLLELVRRDILDVLSEASVGILEDDPDFDED